jgi:FAD/FMN-containing dehydrogenase
MTSVAWTNWAGNQQERVGERISARTVDDLREIVTEARVHGRAVRAVGAAHSFSPLVPHPGVVVDVNAISGLRSVDITQSRATVWAGTTVRALGEPLWEAGLSLSNQGDIDTQTVAGALSTATHGSGLELTSFSGALRSAEIVTASGELVKVGEDHPWHAALQTSLGAIGIMTSVELQMMPAYQLVERVGHWSLAETLERWDVETTSRRHFSFFWGPHPDSLGLYGIPEPPAELSEACYVKRYDQVPADTTPSDIDGGRVDRAYRIYADEYPPGWNELEYFVDYDLALDALAAIRSAFDRHPEQRHPVEVRTLAAERGLLSPAYGRPSVALSVSGAIGTDYWPFLRAVDEALMPFDARAHWGKTHFMDAARLRAVYPRYDEFLTVRSDADPDGTFLNTHLRSLFDLPIKEA